MKTVKIVLAGIGGYGKNFLNSLLENKKGEDIKIAGVVQPTLSKYPEVIKTLNERGIPAFKTLEEFYKAHGADLAVISSPMQYHGQQVCTALENGSNVLCEKPACSTIQDALKMAELSEKMGKFAAIGYQLSFSKTVLNLKKDILDGKFGKAIRLKTLLLRGRSNKYYGRNAWAGKKKDSGGNWVLDSVGHNAGSHNIHNMLFTIGKKIDASAVPVSVEAELYRANPIDNYDTAAARMIMDDGVEVLFFGTHVPKTRSVIKFIFEFEKGKVIHDPEKENSIVAYMADGSVVDYGNPDTEADEKLWTVIKAVRGEAEITCGVKAATPEVLCVNGMQDSTPRIVNFPEDIISEKVIGDTGERFLCVDGLEEILENCFEKNTLPSEDGVKWSKPGRKISLVGYKSFGDGK